MSIRILHGSVKRDCGAKDTKDDRSAPIRNVVIFIAKYFLGVAMAVAPAMRSASAGYFIGWLVRLALKYRSEMRSPPVREAG